MVRQARIVLPGVPHHVTQRGNNSQDVFFVDDDRRVYLAYLRESAERCGASVSAYCLMSNHVHLIVTPETERALASTLGRTHLLYAQYIHRLHGRSGHFWQSRFYSCPMDQAYAHNAAAYVELNPVRAGIVRVPWTYPWSSAPAHCGRSRDASGMLDLGRWFEEMSAEKWKATLKAVRKSDEATAQLRRHTRTGRPLAATPFSAKSRRSWVVAYALCL